MKKVIGLLVLLMVLTGCNLLGGGGLGETPVAVEFRTGIEGLKIEVLEGLPPKEVYEGQNFKIGLKLKNTGAYDLERGEVEIIGFDEKYVLMERQKVTLDKILGKSRTNPEGTFEIEEFSGRALKSLKGTKEYAANYFIVANYDYRSEAQIEVCVNTNLYSDLKLIEESCKPEQSINLKGQGAPVAITKVKEIIMPEGAGAKIVIKLYIENKGKGSLIGPVFIEEVRIANKRLRCEKNSLDLREKKAENVFVCSIVESQPTSYVAPFYASIYYKYQIKEKKSILIKNLRV